MSSCSITAKNRVHELPNGISPDMYFAIYRFASEMFHYEGRGEFIEWLCENPQRFVGAVSCGHQGEFEPTAVNLHTLETIWSTQASIYAKSSGEEKTAKLRALPEEPAGYKAKLEEVSGELGIAAAVEAWIKGVPWEDLSAR